MNNLLVKALSKTLVGLITIGILLFVPAGTIHYPGAWRFIITLFTPMAILGTVLFFKDPALLEKRLNSKEKENTQKGLILFSALMFIASFVVCGLDYRFSWSDVPGWLVIVGCFLLLFSYVGFAELLKENSYLSRTVEIQEGQKVIDTGMYGIVRHPMYTIITVIYLSMPIILGSFWGLIPMIALPIILFNRIKNEEEVLENGLAGYCEYKSKVKYKIFPGIW